MQLFSIRSQMITNVEKPRTQATGRFLPHFVIFCNLLLNRHRATWNLLIFYYEQGRKTDTCLILLDYSRICFSLSILKSQTLLFVLTSSFLLYYTVNSLPGKFFIAFTVSKLWVSHTNDTRWQLS